MSYEFEQRQQQVELEKKVATEYKDRIIEEHVKAGERDCFSSSSYGRSILKGTYKDTGITRVEHFAQVLEKYINSLKPDGAENTGKLKLLEPLFALYAALQQKPEKGASPYGQEGTTPYEILSLLCVRAAVNSCVLNGKKDKLGKSQWPSAQTLITGLGDQIHRQFVDAYCYCIDSRGHKKESGRWHKEHQSAGYKRTNMQLGHRNLVGKSNGLNMDTPQGKKDASEMIARIRWTKKEEVQVGCAIYNLLVKHLDVIEKVKGEKLSAVKDDMTRVKPTDALIKAWGTEVLPALTKDRLVQRPLLVSPIPWSFLPKQKGTENTSGGYYRLSSRIYNPLVRGYKGGNSTIPSQKAVDLVNVLGQTAYVPDKAMMASYGYAIDNRLDGLDVAPPPRKTINDLQLETNQIKQDIKDHQCVFDANGNRLERGTDEHNAWKAKRFQEHNDAIVATSKYMRTVNIRYGILQLAQQPTLHWSWSYDARMRVYPQQAATLNPQGGSAERSLIRFKQGEHMTKDSDSYIKVLEAIGVAAEGGKFNREQRAENGRKAIEQLLPHVTQTDGADIAIVGGGEDSCWELLQLLRCYQRVFVLDGNHKWDVALEADASLSGLQILSAMTLDKLGLIASNVLLSDDYQKGDKPIDGYALVADRVLVRLKTSAFADDYKAIIRKLLSGKGKRALAKSVVMPKPYGSTYRGSRDAVRRCISKKLKINLKTLGFQGDDLTVWIATEKLIDDVTTLLIAATGDVFKAAMRTLKWLQTLAGKSYDQQRKEGKLPRLSWKLSDGTVIDFTKTKMLTHRIDTVTGMMKFPVGADVDRPDRSGLIAWFAPSLVHSLDGQVLREAFSDWGDRPLSVIHDCFRVLPGDLDDALVRVKDAFELVTTTNSLEQIAKDMGVKMPRLKMGDADLSLVPQSEWMFN